MRWEAYFEAYKRRREKSVYYLKMIKPQMQGFSCFNQTIIISKRDFFTGEQIYNVKKIFGREGASS